MHCMPVTTDSLQLLLTGNFSGGIADLLFFPLKFQTNQGSYEPAGCVNGNGCTVPEPGMAGLLLIGLLGLTGITVLRRKKSTSHLSVITQTAPVRRCLCVKPPLLSLLQCLQQFLVYTAEATVTHHQHVITGGDHGY